MFTSVSTSNRLLDTRRRIYPPPSSFPSVSTRSHLRSTDASHRFATRRRLDPPPSSFTNLSSASRRFDTVSLRFNTKSLFRYLDED